MRSANQNALRIAREERDAKRKDDFISLKRTTYAQAMAMLLEAHSSHKEGQLEAFFRASNSANMLNLVAPQKIVLQFSEAMAYFTDNGSIETLYVEASS